MRISQTRSSSAAYAIGFGLAFSAVAPTLATPLFYEAAGQFVSAVQAAAAAQASGSASLGIASTGASVTPAQIKAGNTTGYLFYQCKNPGQMAITFDDGPQSNHTKIRQLLDKYNAKGTFFVNGMNYDCIYDYAEAIQTSYQEGHQFGTHTWGHVDITKLTTAQLNNNMQLVEDAVMKILGVRPAMFRPPYGNFNNDALATVASRNYTAVIIWDVISGASTSMSVQQSLSNYANAIKDGGSHIILQHEQDGDSFGQIYDQVFKELVAAKKQLVTVAQCLNMAPYLSTSKIGTRDSSWTCSGKPGPGQPGR